MVKNVFLDIDGTLLTAKQELPDSARQACLQAIERGHRLFLCTGRTVPEIYPWLLQLPFSGLVAGNGTYGSLGKQVLFQHFLPPAVMHEIDQFFQSLPQVYWAWQNHDATYPRSDFLACFVPDSSQQIGAIEGDWQPYLKQMQPYLRSGLPAESPKAIVVLPQPGPLSLDQLQARFGQQAAVKRGAINPRRAISVEIVPLGVDKGTGLQDTIKALGDSIESTVAIGDSWNDLEMLSQAQLGIAMGGADPQIAQAADWQTDTIERDGLAKALAYAGLLT